MFRRPWFATAAAVAVLLVAPPAVAAENPGSPQAPTTSAAPDSIPATPSPSATPELDAATGLTAEQQAKLDAVQGAVEQKSRDQVSVSLALDAANLAAGVAARAEDKALEASRIAAQAELVASQSEFEAAQLRSVVDAYVRDVAVGGATADQTVVSLIVQGAPPADILRTAESSERTADSITASLRNLVAATQTAQQLRLDAAVAQAQAADRTATAEEKAREAADLLASSRDRLRASTKGLKQLVSGDAVLSYATSPQGIPGCAPPEAASIYPNGMLPAEVLCAPTMAPGHLFRSDAATAFDALARAFADDTGETLCITDSYRSYEAQVALKAQKPYLAATPGTSNHGWGVATDLCGGIELFGTPQHEWMRTNAALFGFMHPSWAQQDGSKPEPWHWEFSAELAHQMGTLLAEQQAEVGEQQKSGRGRETAGAQSPEGKHRKN